MAPRISPEAEVELDEIWLYVARRSGNLEIADRCIDTITESLYLIAINPHMGRRRDEDLRPGIRSFVVGDYIILYRVDEEEDVLVLHIVRGSRDIQALFGD